MNVIVLGSERVLNVSPTVINAPSTGGSYNVTILSSSPWTAIVDNGACAISPTSGGAGTSSMQVTAYSNSSSSPEICTITVYNTDGKVAYVNVNIEGAPQGGGIG